MTEFFIFGCRFNRKNKQKLIFNHLVDVREEGTETAGPQGEQLLLIFDRMTEGREKERTSKRERKLREWIEEVEKR